MVKFRYNYDNEALNNISNKSMGKSKSIINVCAVIIAVCGLIMIATEECFLGITFLVLSTVYFLLVPLLSKVIAKKISKAPMVDPDTIVEYCFKEDTYTLDEILEHRFTSHREAIYDMLYKVEEKPDCFMLWLSPVLVEPLMKCNIVEGSIEELQYLFTINLGGKYYGTRMERVER